ncbi:hypothetical protein Tco_1105435 [Tanacetum coccineum]
MQEFWASAYVHNRSVRFKMNNKKHIIGLDQFRDILQICPKVGNKKFVEPPLEKEILAFLASLGHSGDIRKITDEQFLQRQKEARRKLIQIQSTQTEAPSPKEKEVWKVKNKAIKKLKLSLPVDWLQKIDGTGVNTRLKNDVNETTQDDENDDEHDIDEKAQDDDDEEQTESDDDGDDFETDEDDSFDPTIHTPSRISSSDDEDSDNEVEGTNVEGAKSDEDATYEEDQGNKAVEDTNTDLDGRDDVMTDVILPQTESVRRQLLGTQTNKSNMLKLQLKYEELEDEFSTANQQPFPLILYMKAWKNIIQRKTIVQKRMSQKYSKNQDVSNRSNIELRFCAIHQRSKHVLCVAEIFQIELKKILLTKMEANKLYQQSSYGDTVTLKDSEMVQMMIKKPSAGTDRGPKEIGRKEPALPVLKETMQTTDVFEALHNWEFETGVHDEQAEEEVQHLPDWFQQPTRLPSPDHAWNKSVPAVHESVQPWLSNWHTKDPREDIR